MWQKDAEQSWDLLAMGYLQCPRRNGGGEEAGQRSGNGGGEAMPTLVSGCPTHRSRPISKICPN